MRCANDTVGSLGPRSPGKRQHTRGRLARVASSLQRLARSRRLIATLLLLTVCGLAAAVDTTAPAAERIRGADVSMLDQLEHALVGDPVATGQQVAQPPQFAPCGAGACASVGAPS